MPTPAQDRTATTKTSPFTAPLSREDRNQRLRSGVHRDEIDSGVPLMDVMPEPEGQNLDHVLDKFGELDVASYIETTVFLPCC